MNHTSKTRRTMARLGVWGIKHEVQRMRGWRERRQAAIIDAASDGIVQRLGWAVFDPGALCLLEVR